MKRCSSCALSKHKRHFGRQKDGEKFRPRAICKDCHNEQSKIRYVKQTPEQKLKQRNAMLKRLYGITIEDYNGMFEHQAGKCLTCGEHQSQLTKALVVDHCHTTDRIRGLLCSGCNLALGNVKENINTLYGLVEYLKCQK